MRLILTPPQRARITVLAKAVPWQPGCAVGDADHYSDSMKILLGVDKQGRTIDLCLLPMEAAELRDAIDRALNARTRIYHNRLSPS